MNRSQIFFLACLILLIIPLLAIAYVGTFSRYMADDYCTTGSLIRNGFIDSQIYWYTQWSGRYSFTFVVSLFELARFWVTRILPALAILLWGASLYFASVTVGSSVGFTGHQAMTIILSAYVLLITLIGAPNIYQSLYWQTGMVTYVLPLIFMTAYFAWILRSSLRNGAGRIRIPYLLLSAFIAFILGGFSETYVSLQTAALISFIPLSWYLTRGAAQNTSLGLLGAGLAGSFASMVVIALAPGTGVRIGLFDQGYSVISLFSSTVYDWYIFSARTAKSMPAFLILVVFLPSLLFITLKGKRIPGKSLSIQKAILLLFVIPLVTFLLMLATILPYEYALSSFPDGRVLITTLYVMIAGMASWGILLSALLSEWLATRGVVKPVIRTIAGILVLIGLSYGSIRALQSVLTPIEDYRDFAYAWDSRHRFLSSSTIEQDQVISAASLPHVGGLAEISTDPSEWVNQCVAWVYSLEGVVAK